MSQRRLVEIAIKAKNETQQAFSSLEQSLDANAMKAAKFTLAAGAIGAAVVGAMKAVADFVAGQAVLGDQMEKMGQRLGVAVDKLSEYKFALNRGGGSIGDLETATKRLSRAMAEAQDGTEKSKVAFSRLGISVDQLSGADGSLKSFNDLLPLIADGLRGISSQAERLDLAQELFGRGGAALLPMLQQGASGIRAMRVEMEKYGGAMSSTFAAKSAEFADSQTNLANATARLKEALAEPFLAPFTAAVNKLADAMAKLKPYSASEKSRSQYVERRVQELIGENPNIGVGMAYQQAEREYMERDAAARAAYQPGAFQAWFGQQGATVAPGMFAIPGVPNSRQAPWNATIAAQENAAALGARLGPMPEWYQEQALAGMGSGEDLNRSYEDLGLIMSDAAEEADRLTDGMEKLSEEQIKLYTASDNMRLMWEAQAAFMPAFTSSLDSAFYTALTSTRAFGRAFVDALRQTFADVLASFGSKFITNLVTGGFSGGGGWDKTVTGAAKALPAPLALDAGGRMNSYSRSYYDKVYLS